MRISILWLFLAFLPELSFGQYLAGPLTLESQAQVDSFPLLYPDITWVGTLIIGREDTVNLTDTYDLTPLAQLNNIGVLFISNNGALTTLDGLQMIEQFDIVVVYNNPVLQNLYGLHEITETVNIIIRKNPSLTDLQGLNKLRDTENLLVENCANLTSLNGLDSLRYVFQTIAIVKNPRLKSVSGFPSLPKAGFYIAYNDSLEHFGHFPALREFGFSVVQNAMLEDFSELAPLSSNVTIGIGVYGNPTLKSFTGLEKAHRIALNVENNPVLEDITQFDSARIIAVDIQGPAIKKICFPRAATVSSFEVHNCPRLKTLENVLPQADTVSRFYEIWDNDSLYRIHEDQGPKRLVQLHVHDNPMLEYITGFEALERLSPEYTLYPPYGLVDWGTLRFYSPKFREISGFNNLKTGNLEICVPECYSSFAPVDPDIYFDKIEGFNGMETTSYSILIQAFDSLALPRCLIGFHQLKTIGKTLEIERVRDTISAFQQLEYLGPEFLQGSGRLSLIRPATCRVDSMSFSRLKTVKNAALSLKLDGSYAIKFPELEFGPDASFLLRGFIQDVPRDTVLTGIFPKLKTLRAFGLTNYKHLKSLDGIESFSSFQDILGPGESSSGTHIVINGCDSLADCSALCTVLKNATFSPSNWEKISLDNALFPCDDAANIETWCDSLSSAVQHPGGWVGRDGLRAFPNPVSEPTLTLRLQTEATSGPYLARVVDAMGRIVLEEKLQFYGRLAILPVADLISGWFALYLVKKGEPVRMVSFLRS